MFLQRDVIRSILTTCHSARDHCSGLSPNICRSETSGCLYWDVGTEPDTMFSWTTRWVLCPNWTRTWRCDHVCVVELEQLIRRFNRDVFPAVQQKEVVWRPLRVLCDLWPPPAPQHSGPAVQGPSSDWLDPHCVRQVTERAQSAPPPPPSRSLGANTRSSEEFWGNLCTVSRLIELAASCRQCVHCGSCTMLGFMRPELREEFCAI